MSERFPVLVKSHCFSSADVDGFEHTYLIKVPIEVIHLR